jgi:PAS domain S-box-containing protein
LKGTILQSSTNADSNLSFSEGIADLMRDGRAKLHRLLFFFTLISFLLIAYLGIQERQLAIETEQSLSDREVQRIADIQAALINDTRNFLRELALAPAVLNPSKPACSAFLSQILPLVPQYVNLGIPSRDGRLTCNAAPMPEPINVADRPYIRQALDNLMFSISGFQVDRASNLASINFAYPVIPDANPATPIGAAVAVVSLNWWSMEMTQSNLPEGSVAYVVDLNDQIVAAFPDRADLIGQSIATEGHDVASQKAEIFEVVLETDGVRRVFSRRHLFDDQGHNRISMLIGVPIDIGIAAANRLFFLRLIGLGSALAAILALFYFVIDRRIFGPLLAMTRNFERIEQSADPHEEVTGLVGASKTLDVQSVARSFQKIANQRLQAEVEKNALIERMSALLDAMPDTYFRIDLNGVILEYRATRESDSITEPESFLGKELSKVIPADAYEKFEKQLAIHLRTNEVVEWEYQLQINGVVNCFEARLGSILGSKNEIVIVVRNITVRRNAERGMVFAETRLERIISSLPGAVVSMVLNGPKGQELTYVSKQVEEIWGYSCEDIYADISLLSTAHNSEDVETMRNMVIEAVTTLEPFRHRAKFKTRDGGWKWIENHVGVTRSDDGTLHSDSFILDVTSQVETQALLDAQREMGLRTQKNESIGQLTGGVAHDFNNLLAVIMGNLELLRDDLDHVELVELVDNSIAATLRGAELTQNMLSFARKARLEPKKINLNQILSDTKKWAGRTIPANIEVEMNLSNELWATLADPSSTESALLNLILNARDAMPDGGKLTIETTNQQVTEGIIDGCGCALAPGKYAVLTVSDTGTGIERSVLARIFEPYYTTKPIGKGSGLGLSMTEGFMKQSGGELLVFSEPEIGTTFQMFFPANDPEPLKVEDTLDKINNAVSQGRRILVVEDDPMVLKIIVKALKRAGHDVTSASSGDEALKAFEANPNFELVLTDIVMPGKLQGTSLAKVLRLRNPNLTIIFMSGYAGDGSLSESPLQTEDLRLMKPVSQSDLLAKIEQAF